MSRFVRRCNGGTHCFVCSDDDLGSVSAFSRDGSVDIVVVGARTFGAVGRKTGGGTTHVVGSRQSRFNSQGPVTILTTGGPVVVLSRPRGVKNTTARATLGTFGPLFALGCSTARGRRRGAICILSTLSTCGRGLIGGVRMMNFRLGGLGNASDCVCFTRLLLSGSGTPRMELRVRRRDAAKVVGQVCGGLKRKSSLCDTSKGVLRCGKFVVASVIISTHRPAHDRVGFDGNRDLVLGRMVNGMATSRGTHVRVERAVGTRFQGRDTLFRHNVGYLSLFFVSRITGCHRCSGSNGGVLNHCKRVFRRRCQTRLGRGRGVCSPRCVRCLDYVPIGGARRNCFSVSPGAGHFGSDGRGGKANDSSMSTCGLVVGSGRQLLDLSPACSPIHFVFSRSTLERN